MTIFKKIGITLGILTAGIITIGTTYFISNYRITNIMYLKKSPVTNEFSLEASYDLNSNTFVEYDIITGSFTEMEGSFIENKVTYNREGYGSFLAKIGEHESYGFSFDHPLSEEELKEFLAWYDGLDLYDKDTSYVYIKNGDSLKKIR